MSGIHLRCPSCGARSGRDGFRARGQFCGCGWGVKRKGYRVTRKNIDAGTCANDDGRPVCPPSKVLCRECMEMIGEKLRALLARLENRPVPEEDRLL